MRNAIITYKHTGWIAIAFILLALFMNKAHGQESPKYVTGFHSAIPEPRFFFIGYSFSNGLGNLVTIKRDGNFISYEECIKRIKSDKDLEKDRIMIISIYEFKTLSDMNQFLIGMPNNNQ